MPTPPPPATAPPYPYTPDISTDADSGNCGNPLTFCIIQGSQESIYYVSESCGGIFPEICYSFTSSYSVSGVPSGMLFSFNPASLPGNYLTTLTLRAGKTLAPGSYPLTVAKSVADGRQPTSENLTIQVLCSVRLKTCQRPAASDAQFTCFPDLEPILETGTGIFAKRRAAASASPPVYMSRMSDGTCPTPPPYAAIVYVPADGDFQVLNGSVSVNQAPASLAVEDLSSDTADAQSSAGLRGLPTKRPTFSQVPQASSIPPGYSTPPPYLTLPSDVASKIDNASLGVFVGKAGCTGVVIEQRGNADLTDPRNILYYQIQFYCTLNAVPADVTTHWTFATYNDQNTFASPGAKFSIDVEPGNSNFNLPLDQVYVSQVEPAKLISGHAELNWLQYINFNIDYGDRYSFNTVDSPYGAFFLNNKSVPYPVVSVRTNWGPNAVNGDVPLPDNPPYIKTATGCENSSRILVNLLETNDPPYPKPAPGFEAHHIKPSCWGGSNTLDNAVWLPKATAGYPNLHNSFTTWFKPDSNFTP